MSKPIRVAKGKQKKPRFSFAFVYSFSHLLHVKWPIIKHKSRRVGPASEVGGLIDYNYILLSD